MTGGRDLNGLLGLALNDRILQFPESSSVGPACIVHALDRQRRPFNLAQFALKHDP